MLENEDILDEENFNLIENNKSINKSDDFERQITLC